MRGLILGAILASVVSAQTYTREVSRIFLEKCRICHRPNDIAPFAFETYDDLASRGSLIRSAVSRGQMPPWKPVEAHGEFRDSYALTEDERRLILDWIDAGMPEGDPADLPEAPADQGEWPLGDPDIVLSMSEEYAPPEGDDAYRCFVLPSGTTEDKFIGAVEVLPGNRRTVHHAILFVDTTGEAEKLDASEDGPGYTCFGGPRTPLTLAGALGGWAPGVRGRWLPDGVGLWLPAGASIVMQVHYHPGAEPAPDRTRIGLYFTRGQVERRMIWLPIADLTFEIPPGDPRHEVKAWLPILPFFDSKAIVIAPHMHLLGREIKVEADTPQGTVPLIYINDWDFEWQGIYTYKEPVPLPGFSVLRLSCVFDNSENNPRNPNQPPVPVRWGEETDDEMCIAFVGATLNYERLVLPWLGRLFR